MRRFRSRDVILTVVGFAAWLIYILACGPSFSPDDTKILFPSIDPKTGATTLAMYDRTSRTTRTLLVPRDGPRSKARGGGSRDGTSMGMAWTPDGTRALGLWVESDDVLRVAVVPIAGPDPVRLLSIGGMGDNAETIMMGPAIMGSSLYATTEKDVRRIDLETGDVMSKELDGEVMVQSQRGRLHYLRRISGSPAKVNRIEFGRIDPDALTLAPAFQFDADIEGFWAVAEDGARIAITGDSDGRCDIATIAGGTVQRRIQVGTQQQPVRCGRLIWSRDEAILYSTYRRAVKEGQVEYGVMEVPVDGSAPRFTQLFEESGDGADQDMLAFQVDLSHDQKTLAAASTYIATEAKTGELKPEDVALYLIDLSRADRRITKVPIPAPKTLASGAAGK